MGMDLLHLEFDLEEELGVNLQWESIQWQQPVTIQQVVDSVMEPLLKAQALIPPKMEMPAGTVDPYEVVSKETPWSQILLQQLVDEVAADHGPISPHRKVGSGMTDQQRKSLNALLMERFGIKVREADGCLRVMATVLLVVAAVLTSRYWVYPDLMLNWWDGSDWIWLSSTVASLVMGVTMMAMSLVPTWSTYAKVESRLDRILSQRDLSREQVFLKVRKIAAGITGVPEGDIHWESKLIDDLGMS